MTEDKDVAIQYAPIYELSATCGLVTGNGLGQSNNNIYRIIGLHDWKGSQE